MHKLVIGTFSENLNQIRTVKKVRAIAEALKLYPFCCGTETGEWLGFRNGILNMKSWDFFNFPLNYPPPDITYCLTPSFNFIAGNSLKNVGDISHLPYTSPDILGYPTFFQCLTSWFGTTPYTDQFFSRITGGDPMLIVRIYEMIGYILVPDTSAKVFFLLQGVPNLGKSVLGRFLEGFFLPGCVTALDISRLGGPHLPDAFVSSRLNLSMDLPDGILSSKAIAALKMLTGSDLITHEAKYKEAKSHRGQCKFLFTINGKLKMTDRDTAFLDRIVCIPFRYSIPKNLRDSELLRKLNDERETVLMKALYLYRVFLTHNRQFSGDGRCQPEVEYRLSTNDSITAFVDEKCYFSNEARTHTDKLFSAYQAFCVQNNLKSANAQSGFAQRLSTLYATQIQPRRWRDENGQNIRGFWGIGIYDSPSSGYDNDVEIL